VPSDEDSSRPRRVLSKYRMEGFSDGVFGFAITLLVLDIALGGTSAQPALDRVGLGWPTYLAYLISFLTIGGAWLAHTAMTDQLTRVDSILLRLNLLLLMVVVFLPFPTQLVAEYLREPSSELVFVTMYGITLLVIRVLLFALDGYARREHLYSTEGADPDLSADRKKRLPTLTAYVIVILIGLAAPELAMALYFAIAVYVVTPFRQVGRADPGLST
jgi:TMEM175 potassium channel family protein